MNVLHHSPDNALQFEADLVAQFSDETVNHALAFWTTDQSLVVPASLKRQAGYAAACAELTTNGWPVVTRKTGGGITPQGKGILNIALAYALDPVENPTIKGVYQMFCAPLIKLLAQFDCPAHTGFVSTSFCDGEFNIVVAGRKVMGTAQRWSRVKSSHSRQIVFAHALMLIDADLSAGVNAVNRFYRSCGMQQNIEVDAHVNLCALASDRGKSASQTHIVDILSELYLDELSALTE